MTEKQPEQVAENLVVRIEYTLTVDGEILDSSEENGPLDYLHGHANIIPGLEQEIIGMKPGESKKVNVAPKDGYGEFDPNAVMDVPIDEFPEGIPLELGIELEITDHDGEIMLVTISEVGEEIVKLDTNHPLANLELHFDVKVISIREAAPEEIEHGHAHIDGDHHHD